MTNYEKITIGNEGRVELHDQLKLTGAEVSINQLPAGAGVPFVHSHTNDLAAGDWLKVAPAAKRQFSAAADSGITYLCIQVKENSLGGFTAEDAVVY